MLCFVISVFLVFSTFTDALPSEPYILYSNITNLHTLDLTSFARSNILGEKDRIIPLGFDSVNRHLYFGEHQLGRIYRSNYDGSGVTLIMEDVKNVEGVAIDWIGRMIYWTTYTSETIEVATLNGKYRAVVINAGLEYPRGIAVDPIAGYLFWSDWGAAAAIERSSLDGSNRVTLVTKNITWPNGVTLDTTQRLVYWIDASHDTISSVDYDGNNRRLIFEDTSLSLSTFHGFDLDINGDYVYFTDWLANAIYEVQISTGAIIKNISVPTTNYIKGAMGLRVIHSAKQPSVTSTCGNTNGGCEQLCFNKVPTGTVCKCQMGMKLASNNKSCEDAFKDEFIMFADADAGEIYQMQLDSINVKPIAIPFDPKSVNVTRPVALDHDSRDDRVYWTDVTLQTIGRSFRNGSHYELLFDNFGIADGLAIDFAAGLLYWTSTTNNTVEASKLDGSNRRTLVRWNLDEPRDIIVDPIGGYMYWTDWGRLPRIERAYMNGENRHDLVNTTIQLPNGLTLDHVYNKLYWADAREDNIEVIDLATLERKVVLNQKLLFFGFLFRLTTEVNHPYGLTLLHDKLYWTDWHTDAVYRADVNTGANIVSMAGNLGKPMDIHAYISVPKQQKKIHYTFSFPNRGSNFTCISSRSCPQMDPPPACPPGYTEVRENKTCGLNCRDIVGYTWRCPCNDWMSCAVKERYLWGCAYGYYTSFRVRECVQVVRAGRCPSSGTQGSQSSCDGDTNCTIGEKCCNSKCAAIATIETHPCRTNNGGCDQLCFSVPGGHKCGCRNDLVYDETSSKCVVDTRPSPTAPSIPPPMGCTPHPAPKNGSVDCGGQDPVPEYDACYFLCDPGFDLVGYGWDICYDGDWIDETPTCRIRTRPTFSFCPNDTTVSTDPGKAYALVNWTVPIATDINGTELVVEIWPRGYDPPVKVGIGRHYLQVYAIDKNGEDVYCYFYITVEDQEPPSFNSTCPNDIILYTDNDFAVKLPPTFREPTATDNAKPPNVHRTGFPADSFFPIGRTVVSYTASDAAGLNASCVFSVTVVNVCRGVTCTHGAKCVLDDSTESSHICKCNSFCPQNYDPVCGSDGQIYASECIMNVSSCLSQSSVTVVSKGPCTTECDEINLTSDKTRTVECKENTNYKSVECTITCKPGYESAIPNFQKLQCYNKKWIRANNVGKFVPLASSPAQCYKPTPNTPSGCPNGSGLLSSQSGKCVPCPPGSYKDGTNCTSCEVATYQDKSGQSSCKKCSLKDNSNTSTTTGAESCYFDYSQNAVKLTFEKKSSDFAADSIRDEVAKALTELCEKEECNFVDNTASRKRRAEESHTFKAEDIIIVSIQDVSNNDANAETEIVLLVIDPSSTSLLPNSGFSSEDLNKYIKMLQVQGKLKNLKKVEPLNPPKTSASSGDKSSSKAPIVAGVIVVIVVIVFVVGAVWLYHRRHRNKTSVPPVQFNSVGEGGMQIGHPTPAASNPEYENSQTIQDGLQHGFVNQVYNDVQAPPSYHETPSPNVYDISEQQVAGALPAKDKLPDVAVVDIIPPKDVAYEKPVQADPPKKFFHKRNTLPNHYQEPRSTTPDAEANLKLEPPPKLDDAELQVMRSSILPNVPRKKVDLNADTTVGEGTSRSDFHHVGDVTKEQSET